MRWFDSPPLHEHDRPAFHRTYTHREDPSVARTSTRSTASTEAQAEAPEEKRTRQSRPRKSPVEKAQATLDQAKKRYEKAVAKRDKIAADIDAAEAEVKQARRYLDFAQGDPSLPQLEPPVSDDATDDEAMVDQTEIPEPAVA